MLNLGQCTEILYQLKQKLPEKRFYHTLSVADTAASLAYTYYLDDRRPYLAGLLHDCGKRKRGKEVLGECLRLQLPITQVEREHPDALLHAKLGAYDAEFEYGIKDPEILQAILYHTSGRAAMTWLEKIIFISDYITPGRTQPTNPPLREIRYNAFYDIDTAIYQALYNTLGYLELRQATIEPRAILALQYYRAKSKWRE